jgi:hypothetical protein
LLKAKSTKPTKSGENTNVAINKDLQTTIGKLNLQISQLNKDLIQLPELRTKITDLENLLQ